MSHFIGLCFGDNWESDLEQYYEGLEVEPYIRYTKEEAIEEVKNDHKNKYLHASEILNSVEIESHDAKDYYQKIINKGEFLSDEEAWEIAKDWGYQIDENENLLTTYNHNSKWDWYSVGGRWSGFLPLKEKDSEGNPMTTNEATVGEVDWEYLLENKFPPYCFVNEDGHWYEKGEMGWWGISFNDQPEDMWKQEFTKYLKTLDDNCWVTVVDFHI